MSHKLFLANFSDGHVAPMIVLDGADPAAIAAKITFPAGSPPRSLSGPPREIQEPDLPPDRYFRNAWKDDGPGKKLGVDLGKAKAIHAANLKAEAVAEKRKADADFLDALVENDKPRQAQIAARRRKLAGIENRPEIAQAQTPEALRLLTLQFLADN